MNNPAKLILPLELWLAIFFSRTLFTVCSLVHFQLRSS